MDGMEDLDQALASLDPQIEGRFIYTSAPEVPDGLVPFATVRETEGVTLVVSVEDAAQFGYDTSNPFSRITARVHTSLLSVGITATVTATIASRGIPCNVIAGLRHDYFLVPASREDEALALLQALSTQAQGWLAD